jgi:hypothetical protein
MRSVGKTQPVSIEAAAAVLNVILHMKPYVPLYQPHQFHEAVRKINSNAEGVDLSSTAPARVIDFLVIRSDATAWYQSWWFD